MPAWSATGPTTWLYVRGRAEMRDWLAALAGALGRRELFERLLLDGQLLHSPLQRQIWLSQGTKGLDAVDKAAPERSTIRERWALEAAAPEVIDWDPVWRAVIDAGLKLPARKPSLKAPLPTSTVR